MADTPVSFCELVEGQASRQPDAPAIDVVGHGSRSWSGYHLAGLRWAAALREAGVGRGDPVLTMLPTGFEAVTAWLGCDWLGAVEVPVHSSNRGVWLADIVERIGARVAVVDAAFWDLWEPLLPDAPVERCGAGRSGPARAPLPRRGRPHRPRRLGRHRPAPP